MKSSVGLIGAGLLGAAMQVHAAGGDVRASVGSGFTEIDIDGWNKIKADTTAFDVRGSFKPTDNIFLRGQYLTHSGDKVEISGDKYKADTDIDLLRLAAGYGGNVGSLRLYGAVEYVDVDGELSDDVDSLKYNGDGIGITGGISDQGTGNWIWSVELSLLKLDDVDGASFEASLGYRFTPLFSVIGGVQSYAFEDDYDDEYSFGQVYIGAQLSF